MPSEHEMETLVVSDADRYLGERGLRLIARQFRIGPYIFDLLFEDRHGGKLIVELQKGTLDREHTYKILDYYDEYREAYPQEFIDLMVIANTIPVERKKRLHAMGIAFREMPESEIVQVSNQVALDTPSSGAEKSAATTETHESISNERMAAYERFKEQKNAFVRALQEYDPSIEIVLNWKDLSERNIRERRNWFFVFYPPGWGLSRNPGFGVHITFNHYPKGPERVRIAVGVESPLKEQYRTAFKDEVIAKVGRENLGDFDCWPQSSPKLLEVKIALDSQCWENSLATYRRMKDFNAVVAEKIREFKEKGYFSSPSLFLGQRLRNET